MPASSISSLTSWGLYLLATVALLAILSPVLSGSFQASKAGADSRNLDGLRAVFDALQPGITVTLSFGEVTGSDPIRIGGHLISCASAVGNTAVPSRWGLPSMTLLPSVVYSAQLEGGYVKVVGPG
ncbi:MAG TPA: hypothetical protein VGR56_05950 [Nitrososphaerales archaeon]|nr:hypothetical protein [Nitrososphaerales archaeon]